MDLRVKKIDEELKKLRERFEANPSGIEEAVREEFGIDLSARYVDMELRNPIILAPGPLSQYPEQIERAIRAGFGAIVLKSVVGEDKHGNASMHFLRRKPTFMRWFYDKDDVSRLYPILHWDGGLDLRTLPEYLKFAEKAHKISEKTGTPIIASILCHLPSSIEEKWKTEEWVYTAEKLFNIGYSHIEIDFCPFIKGENIAKDKETVLRWYEESTSLVKEASREIKVIPKLLNLDYGIDFQIEMVKAAKKGGADGITIANRFFRTIEDPETGKQYRTAHGGRELKETNMRQVSMAVYLGIPISATGGIYRGRDIVEYLRSGAQNTQILTYVMKNGFNKAFINLLLAPTDGLVANLH
ncbi:MAG: hypothetical protein RMJ07_05590 [Nitrososphaerota archaeon]|nr:hypothetical protein [Candidatus Bathyarchaeota archaeon]MDW8049135.1 hypothetical protein [Nitrososphaerota archaeon]